MSCSLGDMLASLEALPTPPASEKKSAVKGELGVEKELVIYGKIVDFDQLRRAKSRERQEQWELRIEKSDTQRFFGGVRVRKIDESKYELTIKTMEDDIQGRQEWETAVSRDVFEMVKRLATAGMIKTRYRFPAEGGLEWEVDVFENKDGTPKEWCKIDLEYQGSPPTKIEPPIDLTETIDAPASERTDAQKKFVANLMRDEFTLPNAYTRVPTSS